ncbi:MAG: IPT/TIG domain-containing protein [Candidatus Eremiobacteraeota bacterium]|nr:IPT/TIG domain-containing protein [Candidatus Eremiobacteraeota bacterium]
MQSPTRKADILPPSPPPPNITGVNPSDAIAGTWVEIDGTGFNNVQNVTFRGVTASFKFDSATEVQAVVPAISPGSAPIQITTVNNGLSATSNQASFTVDGYSFDEPDEFDPKKGLPGDSITIHGKDLGTVNQVLFNMDPSKQITTGASQRVVAVVPPDATSGPITLKGPLGSVTSQQNFIVIVPPVLKSVSPQSGPVGTKLTLSGQHFEQVTSVVFSQNGKSYSASYTIKDPRTIKVTVPPGLNPGSATIIATDRAGSGSINFTVTGTTG